MGPLQLQSSQLLKFLNEMLDEVYAQHMVPLINEVAQHVCKGCIYRDKFSMPSSQERDHVCFMMNPDKQSKICLDQALYKVDDTKVFEDYIAIVGQAHHEWPKAQDPVYRMLHLHQDDTWKQQLTDDSL